MNVSRLLRVVAVLLGVHAASAGAQTTLYVNDGSTLGDKVGSPWCPNPAPGVSGPGCGTCAAPCASLQELLLRKTLAAGDKVLVNTGLYTSTGATDYPTVTASGSAAALISITGATDAAGTPLAVLDAANQANTCLWINGAKHLSVQGLECKRTTNPGAAPWGHGVYVTGTADGVVLTRLKLHTELVSASFPSGAAIWVETAPGPLLGSLQIVQNTIFNSNLGVWVQGAPFTTIDIVANEIREIDGTGVRVDLIPAGATTRIVDNIVSRTSLGAGATGCFGGIVATASHGVLIQGNQLYANGCKGIDVGCFTGTCVPDTNPKVVFNTLHGNLTRGLPGAELNLFQCSLTGAPLEVRNNIVVLTSTAASTKLLSSGTNCSGAGSSSDFNLFYAASTTGLIAQWNGTTYSTLAAYAAASGKDLNSLSVDPLFVDDTSASLGARSYRLRSRAGHYAPSGWVLDAVDSPAIDHADPTEPFGNEPFCNGGRANLGAFGSTATASRSYGRCALAFTTPPRTFTVSTCPGDAGVISVALRDGLDGGAVAGILGQRFTATSTSPTSAWFSDDACATSVPGGTFTLPAGAASQNLYYVDQTPGRPTISLTSAGGLQSPAPQQHTVAPGPATRLAFLVQPSSVVAGATLTPPPAVEVRDAWGNRTTSSAAMITVGLAANPGASTLSGALGVAADGGLAVFPTLNLDKAAAGYRLSATSPLLASATSGAFDVAAGAAARLVVSGFPGSVTAGTSHAFGVTVEDGTGNVVTTFAGTVAFTSSDPSAVLPPPYAFGATDQGAGTFSATLSTVGVQDLGAGDTVQLAVAGKQAGIVVLPRAVASDGGGVGSADGGRVADAGAALDGGAADAGGSGLDAGLGDGDAGTVAADGGGPDGAPVDAGSGWAPIVDLGCGCSAGGGPTLAGLLLLVVRSRRRPGGSRYLHST